MSKLAELTEKLNHDGITYSAYTRCRCGDGLAYRRGRGDKSWRCAAVIRGDKPDDPAHDVFPFVFWEIKSENQPSANGATTRPQHLGIPA